MTNSGNANMKTSRKPGQNIRKNINSEQIRRKNMRKRRRFFSFVVVPVMTLVVTLIVSVAVNQAITSHRIGKVEEFMNNELVVAEQLKADYFNGLLMKENERRREENELKERGIEVPENTSHLIDTRASELNGPSKEIFLLSLNGCNSMKDNQLYKEYADAFINAQNEYGVSAFFIAAVCQAESSGGQNWDLIDPSTNNIFSIREDADTWASYETIPDSINAFCELIRDSDYYYNGGNYTVDQIGASYCPDSEEWVYNVHGLMTDLIAEASGFNH